MSILSDKYNVPQSVIKNMMQDGVISCSWATWEEVYRLHKEGKSVGDIAHECRIAYRTVHHILKKFK